MDKNISILDSTLRDGGYCNNWEFGVRNKRRIIDGLITAKIDIIECGLLCDKNVSENQSRYSVMDKANSYISNKEHNGMFVILMNYGDYDVEKLPECLPDGIDGIRVAFHKKDLIAALEVIKKIKEKKYKVFLQPMVTIGYSTDEFVELLKLTNDIEPYAFYIVDSFGCMKSDEVKKYSSLADYILKKNIILGLHSHNNLQLAYSNAQLFVNEVTDREAIVDCCIMGMGRGAGNLNTELFLSFANDFYGASYKVEPILKLIDEIINIFYQKNYWGYSLPNYLSATYCMHPNYGAYISDKNTLTISMMGELLSLVDSKKRCVFDEKYMENLYLSYMRAKEMEKKADNKIADVFCNKEILVVAPGKSVDDELDKIKKFIDTTKVITIGVNFDLKAINMDYVFLSNPKRCKNMSSVNSDRIIVTSNVNIERYHYIVDYFGLLCEEKDVRDNAAMMLIKLLINSGVKKIYLAGVDGYCSEIENNYTRYSSELVTSTEHILRMNRGMNNMLKKYAESVNIEFVTSKKRIGRNNK